MLAADAPIAAAPPAARLATAGGPSAVIAPEAEDSGEDEGDPAQCHA